VALQGALLSLAVVHRLVKVMPLIGKAAAERAVVLLSRLVMLPGGHFAMQYVDSGGLQPQLTCMMLAADNRPGMIVDSLIIFSILARASRDHYPALHKSGAYPLLLALLRESGDSDVRARVCNLVGNMCRHSDFFYEPLEQHGILTEVVTCASDREAATRKFSCFAIGNAAFHSPALYGTLRVAIPALVACLKEPVEKTRSNAAGALGNLVRNSSLLARDLCSSGAVAALMAAAEPEGGVDSSSRVALYSLGTVAAYAECKKELSQSGFLGRLEDMVSSSGDRTTAKYAQRVLDRISGAAKK